MGTFLTNYTCSVAPGRRLLSMAGAPMAGAGATSAGSTPRARTDRRTRRALPRREGRSRRGGMTRVAGTGHPSNPLGRRGHVLAGGAPSGSLHGRGRAGRRQKPSRSKFTWSRTSLITSLITHPSSATTEPRPEFRLDTPVRPVVASLPSPVPHHFSSRFDRLVGRYPLRPEGPLSVSAS